jgi:hypothetical protein
MPASHCAEAMLQWWVFAMTCSAFEVDGQGTHRFASKRLSIAWEDNANNAAVDASREGKVQDRL